MFWQQHRLTMRRSQLVGLDDYYRPTLRLYMLDKDNYQFFNNFAHIDDVMRFEDNYRQPCLTVPERSHNIERLAWCEALNLYRLASMNHPTLFQAIYNMVPKGLYAS